MECICIVSAGQWLDSHANTASLYDRLRSICAADGPGRPITGQIWAKTGTTNCRYTYRDRICFFRSFSISCGSNNIFWHIIWNWNGVRVFRDDTCGDQMVWPASQRPDIWYRGKWLRTCRNLCAPLTTFLLHNFTLRITFIVLGIFYCIVIYLLHFLIKNQPENHIPDHVSSDGKDTLKREDYSAKEMTGTFQFYILWLMFFYGTFAGLKILGQLSNIGKEQAGLTLHGTSLIVIIYAFFNCFGRFISGILSDKIERRVMLFSIFLIQVISLSFFAQLSTLLTLAIGTALLAFSFGGMLSIFSSLTADYFGLKNLGLNYGIIFTAWGVGGVLGPLVGGIVRDQIGGFAIGYIISIIVSAVGLILSLFVTKPKYKRQA